MVYTYPTLNPYIYNLSKDMYHYVLYIKYMFLNMQPTLWHSIQAHLPISTA